MPYIPKPNDTAFTVDGRKVRFIAQSNDGLIVCGLYRQASGFDDDLDDEDLAGSIYTVDKLFPVAPVEVVDAKVAEQEAQLEALRAECDTLYKERNDLQQGRKAILDKCGKFAALKSLEAFVDGAITHLVIVDYASVRIEERDAALTESNRNAWDRSLKLLTLYGDAKGNLGWCLNRYSDGSGGITECYPCLSLDEARAKAAEVLQIKFDECRAKTGYMHGFNYYLASATRLGLPVPADLADRWRTSTIEALRGQVEKIRAELEKNEAALRECEAQP